MVEFDKQGLLKFARSHFKISWDGGHGANHWARVYNNGQLLCKHTKDTDPLVVELFAWTHDLERQNEFKDFEHGPAAARLILTELQGRFFNLNNTQLDHLTEACIYHSEGGTQHHPTVQACWDSDRLDLGRCGIMPLAQYLCTEHAKLPETIAWAYAQSMKWYSANPNHF